VVSHSVLENHGCQNRLTPTWTALGMPFFSTVLFETTSSCRHLRRI
jgi:hypothetical protein